MYISLRLFFFFLFLRTCLLAEIASELMNKAFEQGITVDLHDPEFCDGILKTEQGGVIAGKGIRIQARHITYTRKMDQEVPVIAIEASQDLMIEFNDYLFIGERIEYDFYQQSGTIYGGRTFVEPWFIGGDVIMLCPDGSYTIENAFVTSSEGRYHVDWELKAATATLEEDRYLTAHNVQLRIRDIPFLWVPRVQTDLVSLGEHPISYTVGWGGRQGPRVGFAYQIVSWNRWKAYARFDYRLRRGPGGGLETYYLSTDHRTAFESINYVARDVSIFNRHERTRYRFQGAYNHTGVDNRFSVSLTYDKLSDEDMASDYADQRLQLEPSERTQLEVRRQEDWWIANFFTRVRLNNFETVKQELPTFYGTYHPWDIFNTGVISDNQFKLSYLDFVYAHGLPHAHDFCSSRFAFNQRFYRPFYIGPLNVTPEVGGTEIFYGNSPHGHEKFLFMGMVGCDVNTSLFRFYGQHKHVMEPYARLNYYTFPTVAPDKHYIFDIEDGFYRLGMVRFGSRQSWYRKNWSGDIKRTFYVDLYANGFIDIETIPGVVPKVYAYAVWEPNDYQRHTFRTAWDFHERQLDHFNVCSLWTLSPDFAISVEYRHRDAFSWRKVDRENFFLDAFRSIDELLHSTLSDRRDTALIHLFYRYHPNWAIEFESLCGWNRKNHSRYTEFEIDLLGTLRSSAQVKIAYQHRVSDDRVAVYFSLGTSRPDRPRCDDYISQF